MVKEKLTVEKYCKKLLNVLMKFLKLKKIYSQDVQKP